MMMIVLRLLSLLGLKCRCHWHFGPHPRIRCFFRGAGWLDSWTPGLKPLCHRHPAYPHPSGLLWTPWTPDKGDSTKRNCAPAAAEARPAARAVPPTYGMPLRRLLDLQPELADGLLAHHELLDLARDGHREFTDELDVA